MGERRYPAELRAELVRLARSGRRVDELSAEFGPSPSMIRLWLRAGRAGPPVSDRPGLRHTHPDLAGQVDPDRHPDVDLDRITAGSRRRLWWRCPAGHGWEARVASRTAGAGCPVCAGRYPAGIATTHPALAAQLDPDRNPNLDPDTLTAGSERTVWWRCPEGHVWPAQVVRRAGDGTGCPVCGHRQAGRRSWQTRTVGPGLAATHPDLAAQIDRLRHPALDLDRVTAGSERKLWWRCPTGHVWPAQVKARTAGQGCPVCAGQRPGPLAATHARLAAELHPTRNPDITARTVHAGGHGLLWWRCREGHEWEDTPARRAQGAPCPVCDPGPTRSRRRLCAHVYSDPADPRAGTRCRGAALPGSEWCAAHQADRPARCTAPPRPAGPAPGPPGPATPPASPTPTPKWRTALPKALRPSPDCQSRPVKGGRRVRSVIAASPRSRPAMRATPCCCAPTATPAGSAARAGSSPTDPDRPAELWWVPATAGTHQDFVHSVAQGPSSAPHR